MTDYLCNDIERNQKRAMWVIYPDHDYKSALDLAGLDTLSARREKACKKFVENMKDSSHKLHHLIPSQKVHKYPLRNPVPYEPPKFKTERAKGSLVNWYLSNFNN